MIDTIKTLLNKTVELEDKINNLSLTQNSYTPSNSFVCFSKGLINLSFSNTDKLLLAEFETIEDFALYFQNQIELNVPISQTIKISLSINNITFFSSSRKLQAGYNQFTIMKSYLPLKSEPVKLYLKIKTEDNSPITIISNNLLVWGICNHSNEITYQSIEANEYFYLSYLNNNSLFYAKKSKENTELNSEDFTYYASATSYSFVYLDASQKVYLFRIDLDGNLFYSDFETNNEVFITSGVSDVSTASNGNIILISIIKNGVCYSFEMNEQENFSTETEVDSNGIIIAKSYLYFNNYNNLFYIILTDQNNYNYITKSLTEYSESGSHITANYLIEFSTYEVSE